MADRVLVCVAWPYANGPLHLGHIAGAYLPADIFVRYQRAKGVETIMVSGSDQHGTPITVRAEQESVSPADVAARYHAEFVRSWEQLGISFDIFTRTGTSNHATVVQDIFLTLLERGHIYKGSMDSTYCPSCVRFLPDRYVEGRCPFCGYDNARGDQCDNCGRPLNSTELLDARCKFCGGPPEIRATEHFFLRLSAFTDELTAWIKDHPYWKPNVRNFTNQWLSEGLRDRAITRDIEWGIPVPVPGFDGKRIYVWFEAVIGYLSATKEWAQLQGQPEKWEEFWKQPCRSYYFIGKDNIPFHTIIWPAILMGYGGLNLPYDVPANEHLTLEGRPFSTSRNWAVWVPDYLSRYDPDALRYVMSINMPELGDADFSWREFVRRNNDELVATYGNLVHRVLTFTYRNFEQAVPTPGLHDSLDQALLEQAERSLARVGDLIEVCHFREATREALALAQEANRYLDRKAPWETIKTDRQACATALYVAIQVINTLKVAFGPFLPFSSSKLHSLLGFSGNLQDVGWRAVAAPAGQALQKPAPLFVKLDEEQVIEEETRRLSAMKPK
ncbi:MAG: methionine--tRNA ligase [Chloroflexota bacterium]|nr:MAG: methionine--tRNA ligase [Chloroflexota bacterium]